MLLPIFASKMPASPIRLAGILPFNDNFDYSSKALTLTDNDADDAAADGRFYSMAGSTDVVVAGKKVKRNKFHINRPLVVSTWDKIIIAILVPFTAGLALLFLKPWLEFRHYGRAISKMRIDGRRVRFTGDLADYMVLYIQNLVLSVVTLGIYALLGVPDRKIADYVDSHIEWDDSPLIEHTLPEPPKVE